MLCSIKLVHLAFSLGAILEVANSTGKTLSHASLLKIKPSTSALVLSSMPYISASTKEYLRLHEGIMDID